MSCSIIRYEYNFEVSHFVPKDIEIYHIFQWFNSFSFRYERTSIAWWVNKQKQQPTNQLTHRKTDRQKYHAPFSFLYNTHCRLSAGILDVWKLSSLMHHAVVTGTHLKWRGITANNNGTRSAIRSFIAIRLEATILGKVVGQVESEVFLRMFRGRDCTLLRPARSAK